MAELSIAERVANGVEWLEQQDPWWHERISVAALDIEDCKRCVLGQLFGSFQEAPEMATWTSIGLDDEWVADDRGFNGRDIDMPLLTGEWRRVISERRRAARRELAGRAVSR